MNNQLKTGDVVRDSDGNAMSVHAVSDAGITCDWFDERNRPKRKVFKLENLVLENVNS